MSECIFCQIVSGKIPSEKVYEDEQVLAFKDINPKAPVHILVIPKKHIPTLNDIEAEDAQLIGRIHLAIKEIAARLGFAGYGYNVINNCGAGAGQIVFHIHFHLLSGAKALNL
ncbi:MAG TPA: histidine triad nucleotide-binding protein [Firmicutes bacterium]|nr:histidine triad nucleotide-binding protein [Bacillota bacterium]